MKLLITQSLVIATILFSLLGSIANAYELPYSHTFDCGSKKKEDDPKPEELASLRQKADHGDISAMTSLGSFMLFRKDAPQIKEQGLTLLKQAAEMNSADAQLALGYYYSKKGEEDKQWYSHSIPWLEKAVAQDNPDAMSLLAGAYAEGHGVAQDINKAARLATKAAELGNSQAQVFLAILLFKGEGAKKDPEKGFRLVKKAVDAGDCAAPFFLFELYFSGEGTKKNPDQAIRVLEGVYAKGDGRAPLAAFYLGRVYVDEKKIGLYDRQKAIYWLTIAANANVADAKERLDEMRGRK